MPAASAAAAMRMPRVTHQAGPLQEPHLAMGGPWRSGQDT